MKKIICIIIALTISAAAFGCAASSRNEVSTSDSASYEAPLLCGGASDDCG